MEVESYNEFDDTRDELMEMVSLLLIMRRRRERRGKIVRKALVEPLNSGLDKSFYWKKNMVNIIVSYKNCVKVIMNISSDKTYYNKLLGNEW